MFKTGISGENISTGYQRVIHLNTILRQFLHFILLNVYTLLTIKLLVLLVMYI